MHLKHAIAIVTVSTAAIVALSVFLFSSGSTKIPDVVAAQQDTATQPTSVEEPGVVETLPEAESKPARPVDTSILLPPLADAGSRVTKKPFGLEVHPETSPVPNDRFNGFHVGVDFETFPEEQETDVQVSAICTGPLLFKKWATGYGGVAVQHCRLDGEDVTAIYGHLDVETVDVEAGDQITAGERLGLLGQAGSKAVDGVRKHLHLGIHKGLVVTDIRGYAKDEVGITDFLDAQSFIKY